MKRLIGHHAGSTYKPSAAVVRAYHGSIDGDGQRHLGKFPVLNNAAGVIRKGRYAAHTWKLNTGSIGRSICAMHGHKWSDPMFGNYPVKVAQYDELAKWFAEDAIEWGIPVEREFILSHAEVQITLGVTQRSKWDFDYDPRGGPSRDPVAIGDEFRQEVLVQIGDREHFVVQDERPVLRQGAVGTDVKLVQAALGINDDGRFGPITRRKVAAFQRKNGLLPDGVVGGQTWAALL